MDHSYYGRLDNTKAHFTIGDQLMDARLNKKFNTEMEKFKEEMRDYFNGYKKEHAKDLNVIKRFVETLLKSFEVAKVEKVRDSKYYMNKLGKQPKPKDIEDKVEKEEDEEDF